MSQRIGYLDIARGIGILLVVLGHNDLGGLSPFAHRFIYSFHIPLFFFLSGYFLDASIPFLDYFRKRFHAILKPYLFTIVLIYFASVSFEKMGFQAAITRIIKSLYGSINYIDWGQLWFLPQLFVVSLYAYLVVRVFRRLQTPWLRWVLLLVTLLLSIPMLRAFYPFSLALFGKEYQLYGLPFGLDLVLLTGFYFLLGNEVRPALPEKALDSGLLFAGAAIGLLLLNFLFTTRVDIAVRVYESVLVNMLEALLGILLVLTLARRIEIGTPRLASLFKYLGNISLVILLFHVPIQAFWGEKVLALTNNLPLSLAIGFLMGVLGPVLIHEIFIRYNPIASWWFGRKADQLSSQELTPLQEDHPVANPSNTPVIEIKEQ